MNCWSRPKCWNAWWSNCGTSNPRTAPPKHSANPIRPAGGVFVFSGKRRRPSQVLHLPFSGRQPGMQHPTQVCLQSLAVSGGKAGGRYKIWLTFHQLNLKNNANSSGSERDATRSPRRMEQGAPRHPEQGHCLLQGNGTQPAGIRLKRCMRLPETCGTSSSNPAGGFRRHVRRYNTCPYFDECIVRYRSSPTGSHAQGEALRLPGAGFSTHQAFFTKPNSNAMEKRACRYKPFPRP